jgi:cytochrome c-type biogenesis protein CcmF
VAQFGDLFIYSATACAALSAILYLLVWRGEARLLAAARNAFRLATALVVAALGTLVYLIMTHDFGVAYVYSYSSLDLPWYYLISSLWGGQEGTFLLWLFYTCILGLIMLQTAKQFERGTMFFLSLFVLSLLFIVIKKSPFEVTPIAHADGAGLNPLLQNFWMTIHPPIMFFGFAGAAFPFCFALTALVERKYDVWSEAARRWTMFAWIALGVSLVMGGYWAYETLGWGGFWAWDPVENSSLIPWLFLTAQVHSLFIKRQRRGLMRFSLFVACLTFWSVLYGTFLTRSGVLADFSVHSFVDLGINQFLVGGLGFFVLLSTFLLVFRWSDIAPAPSYSRINSRSYLVTLGVVILFISGLLVMIGTSAPLLTRLAEKASAVGQPYYFSTMTPIAVAILLLLTLFPTFRWNEGLAKPKLLVIGTGTCAATTAVLLISGFTNQPIYLALFGSAASALVVNGYVFVDSLRRHKLQAGYLSHVGLAIALLGAAVTNGFETKQQVVLAQNQTVSAMGYNLKFTKIERTAKGFDCHVEVSGHGHDFVAVLPHEYPKNSEGIMRKPYIESYLGYDLYLSPTSVDQPQQDDPGTLYLKKGQTVHIDKYELTFHRFELANHGGATDSMMTAAAMVALGHDGRTEDVAPSLEVVGTRVSPVSASADSGRITLTIAGVRPEDGGVALLVTGPQLPAPTVKEATLVLEVSKKPLILLFWLGTLIAFTGGGISWTMWNRRRKMAQPYKNASTEPRTAEGEPVSRDAA